MIIAPDVSYYQAKVDDTFDRDWLIFRACDGEFLDPNAEFNADWARGAVAEGRIKGWTMYSVYRPGLNSAVLLNLSKLAPYDRLEVDIESWGGAIVGDHSDDINNLILDFAVLVGQSNVWRYGNHGDLASIHPTPIDGQLTRVASYTPGRPELANLIGWQYTNGTENHTTNPASSAPFGACDHNELYVDELPPDGGGVLEEEVSVLGYVCTDDDGAGWFVSLVDNTKVYEGDPNGLVTASLGSVANRGHVASLALARIPEKVAPATAAPSTPAAAGQPQSGTYQFTPEATS